MWSISPCVPPTRRAAGSTGDSRATIPPHGHGARTNPGVPGAGGGILLHHPTSERRQPQPPLPAPGDSFPGHSQCLPCRGLFWGESRSRGSAEPRHREGEQGPTLHPPLLAIGNNSPPANRSCIVITREV